MTEWLHFNAILYFYSIIIELAILCPFEYQKNYQQNCRKSLLPGANLGVYSHSRILSLWFIWLPPTLLVRDWCLILPLCGCVCVHICTQLLQSCLTFWDPMDCSLPGSSVHGTFQARLLEWVAMPSSRRSSQPRDWTSVSYVSRIAGRFFTIEPPGKPHDIAYCLANQGPSENETWCQDPEYRPYCLFPATV